MVWRATLILVAMLAALLPLPADVIERAYSTGLYPRLQAVMTSVSNRAPFALFDVLMASTMAGWLLVTLVDVWRSRGSLLRIAWRVGLRTAVWTAAFYLVFLVAWGLNYRRTPLSDKLQFDPGAISRASLLSLATTTVEQLNALHGRAHAAGWPAFEAIDPSLTNAFERAQGELGSHSKAVAGRPKTTWLTLYFRSAGVAGMTDPYFLETLVEGDLLPFERPFVLAHEWSHLAGFADESEANFVGWLTCLRGSPPIQYSGWLFLHGELGDAMDRRDGAALAQRLGPGPKADVQAIAQRLRRQVNPRVSNASWRVYDRYLRANRVEAGAASYAEVVRLVLGVRFGPGWTPRLRT